jgi:hypothetical protein
LKIVKKLLNKKSFICASLLTIGVVSALFHANNKSGVNALQGKFDMSLRKVNYQTLNTIDMKNNAILKSEILMNDNLPEDVMIQKPNGVIKDHILIAETLSFELYFLEESLSIIVRDKSTGAIMESTVQEDDGKSYASWQSFMKSGIVLQVLKGINIVPTTVDVRVAKKQVTITENGFIADLEFDKYGIGLQLKVSLGEDGIVVEIPNESIIENSEEYKIGEIYIYPFLGNTHLGERNGYMFIPDGNGAIIYLEDNEGRFTSCFSQYVYGMNVGLEESYTLSLLWDTFQTVNEADKIMAPVFGMVHKDSKLGYLGIIESGDYSAKIEAYPNGAYTDYNWISSKFILRQIYTQPTGNREGSIVTIQAKRNEFDIKVRYNFVNGENADYTGLAKNYRNYLLQTNSVKKATDDFKIRLDFLGIDKEPWMIFKKNVVMTTVDNIREIYSDLSDYGVTDIMSIYKGWQKNGINAVPITKFKADKDIGGSKELADLMNDATTLGIDFYLYQDTLRVNPDLSNANFNIMKQITKRVYEEWAYKYVFEKFRYLTPNRSMEIMESSMKSYKKNDVSNIALSGITNILFTYTNKGLVYGRGETAATYETAVSNINDELKLVMEKPLYYLWKYTDAIYDMPVSSSNYIFTDEEVPFLSIALKGIIPMYAEYTNFEANKQEFFLQLIEMGINPSFYITYEDPSKLQYTYSSDIYSSKYSVYKDTIIQYYNELKEVNAKVKGAYITDHKQYSNGMTVISYDNGIMVYVNYNTKAAILVDGYEIAPMSYKVGGG